MKTALSLGCTLILLTLLPARLAAQHLLYAEHEGSFRLVARVDRAQPQVVVGDKLVPASVSRFSLRKVEKFGAWYVNIKSPKITSQHAKSITDGTTYNHELAFSADLESGYPLDNVFIVVRMLDTHGAESLVLREIGQLRPREPKHVDFTAQLTQRMDDLPYTVHLFSNGIEFLHSLLPPETVAQAYDQMVAEKLKGAKDGPPRPLAGPPPLYPEALRKARVAGSATVSFEVSASGVVVDPQVKEANDPAFGEAAIAAIREWRFVPKVKDGHPVAAKVAMPFTFSPPAAAPTPAP